MNASFRLCAAVLLFSALSLPARAACDPGERVIALHHSGPGAGDARAEAASALAGYAGLDLEGRACVETRAGAGSDADLAAAVSEGRVEMAILPAGALGRYSRRFLVFELPFLFDDIQAVLAFQDSRSGTALLDAAAPAGIEGLAFLIGGFEQIGAVRPVVAPSDLAGLGFRVSDSELEAATAATLDADPVDLQGADLATALAEGRVAALDGSWSALRAAGVSGRVAGFTETNHAVQQYVLVAAGGFWEALAPDLRTDLELLIAATAFERNKFVFQLNEAAKYQMIEGGVAVRALDDAERLAWVRAMQTVWFGFGGDIGFDLISTAIHANNNS